LSSSSLGEAFSPSPKTHLLLSLPHQFSIGFCLDLNYNSWIGWVREEQVLFVADGGVVFFKFFFLYSVFCFL
jgi:hypothetical protein